MTVEYCQAHCGTPSQQGSLEAAAVHLAVAAAVISAAGTLVGARGGGSVSDPGRACTTGNRP